MKKNQLDKLADKVAKCRELIEKSLLRPIQVFYNDADGVVAVLWSDGLRSKSTCDDHDNFDLEVGIAFCIAKRLVGKKNYKKLLVNARFQPPNIPVKKKKKAVKKSPNTTKNQENEA